MDVDPRKLRYFAVVAEELHFGRAAERLHITQPVLSRQIRALEHELRARLFDRNKQSTELTAAGHQLLEDAGPLLASAQALTLRVQRAAHGASAFTVGFMPGITVDRPGAGLLRPPSRADRESDAHLPGRSGPRGARGFST
ncbi:LysR family transcriptional regulator [Streptomyces sp. NPDC051217]|uniref:LysR family transcriptional regulator n=1 Tax=Streptomyces sp. NPDC051217 TaxID=3365644 RepID=UPI00378B2A59